MQGWVNARAGLRKHNLHLARRARTHRHQYVLDGRRPAIHTSQDQQVVGAPDAADAYTCAATDAGVCPDHHAVARAEAHKRDALTVDMREDHFALHFGAIKWQGLPSLRVDDFEDSEVGSQEMHAIALITIGGIDGDHIGVAETLGDECSPILFDALAHGWHTAARFRANLDTPDTQRTRFDMEFIAHVLRQVDGIRGGAGQLSCTQVLDRGNQAVGRTDSNRDEGRADFLDRVVQGQAAHEKAHTEPHHDYRVGAHALRPVDSRH